MAVVAVNHAGQSMLYYVPMHLMQVGFAVVFRDWQTRTIQKVTLSQVGQYTLSFHVNDNDRNRYGHESPASQVRYESDDVLPCLLTLEESREMRKKLCRS